MWCVKETPGITPMEATVLLDVSKFGQGFPKGFSEQQINGFSFYELKGYKDDISVENYITSRITETPVLIAVTESQFKNWKKEKIIAKPSIFIYNE